MECQECHERPATLHFTQVINGEKSEIHVCEQCAKEKGYVSYGEEAFSFHNLLSGLFNSHPLPDSNSNTKVESNNGIKCEKCGLTYQEFTRIGKFGCAQCYKSFNQHLNPIFRRVHSGNTQHHGKVPKREGGKIHLKKKIQQQKMDLQQLIQREEFEEAAQVRDRIRSMESELHRSSNEEGES